jgi:hypothetical protein
MYNDLVDFMKLDSLDLIISGKRNKFISIRINISKDDYINVIISNNDDNYKCILSNKRLSKIINSDEFIQAIGSFIKSYKILEDYSKLMNSKRIYELHISPGNLIESYSVNRLDEVLRRLWSEDYE